MEEAKNNGTWKGYWAYKFDFNSELASNESSEMFLEIRNLLMLTIIPKKMDKKDYRQSAYLKAAVSRVKINFQISFIFIFFSDL